MIKKFKEYVSEGLWKSGVERAKSGEERLEDVGDSNIKNLKPVDMGQDFYFADDILKIEGEEFFSFNDMMDKYANLIKKYNWRLITSDDLDSLKCDRVKCERKDGFIQATNKDNGECVHFEFGEDGHILMSFYDNEIKEYSAGYWMHLYFNYSKSDEYFRGLSTKIPNHYKVRVLLVRDKE